MKRVSAYAFVEWLKHIHEKNTCFRGEKGKHSLLVFRKESRYART